MTFLISEWGFNDCAPELSISTLSSKKMMPFVCLGSYLAGLIEGDGTVTVPTRERSLKGKLNNPSIQIAFQSRDFPIVMLLCQVLGHGSISKKKQSAAHIYTINNLKGLIHVSDLVNGKMRGPKIHQFIKLIEYINKKSPELNITAMPSDTTPLGQNSWLAGFIEANGSFQVRTSLECKQPRLALSFELVQARTTRYGYSTLELMQGIADFLSVRVNPIREDRKHPQYRIRTSSVSTNKSLQNYLMNNPLYGSKYLDFKDWCTVLTFFESNTHWLNKEHIVEIKSQINQGRTIFS